MAMHLIAVACSMLAGLTLVAPNAKDQATDPFGEAMQAYSMQRFRLAFDGLARLADAGDGNAARIALMMVAHGPRLFGERFDIASQRRTRWLDLASALALHNADQSEPGRRPGGSVNSAATPQPPM